jgi:hypothetical protein
METRQLKRGTFSQEAICTKCGEIFLVMAKIANRCDICPRCDKPHLFTPCLSSKSKDGKHSVAMDESENKYCFYCGVDYKPGWNG